MVRCTLVRVLRSILPTAKPEYIVTLIRLGLDLQALKGVVKNDKQTGFAIHNPNYHRVLKYLFMHRCWIQKLFLGFFFLVSFFSLNTSCSNKRRDEYDR